MRRVLVSSVRSSKARLILGELSMGVVWGALDEDAIGENRVERVILASLPYPESGEEGSDCSYWEWMESPESTLGESWLMIRRLDRGGRAGCTMASMEWGVGGLGAIKSSGLMMSC